MIAGRAVCKIFDGMTQDVGGTTYPVANNMGNMDALQKFIAAADQHAQPKFPMIFYVVKRTEEYGGYHYVDTELIIMTNTKEHYLYKERTDKTYSAVIEPIYLEAVKRLKQNPYITLMYRDKQAQFAYMDRPNYGIRAALPEGDKQSESTVTDYVDARIVDLKIRVKANCIT